MRDDLPAPFYTSNRVAIMGDAAHATTPWQGQGPSQAIEDACVLSALLGRVHDPKYIPNASSAYDQVRRARSQRVVSTSRETGRMMGFMEKGLGDDLVEIRKRLDGRMN